MSRPWGGSMAWLRAHPDQVSRAPRLRILSLLGRLVYMHTDNELVRISEQSCITAMSSQFLPAKAPYVIILDMIPVTTCSLDLGPFFSTVQL